MGQTSTIAVPSKPFQPSLFVCKASAFPSEARFLTHSLITIVNTYIGPAPADCPVNIFYRSNLQMGQISRVVVPFPVYSVCV
jgi:hypothetical protein